MTNTDSVAVSNADVVRLRGRRTVMRQAWFRFKQMGVRPFAQALAGAWAGLRASITLDRKFEAKAAKIRRENKARDIKSQKDLDARKAAYTGDRNNPSPLNPFYVRDPQKLGGKWGGAYCETAFGR